MISKYEKKASYKKSSYSFVRITWLRMSELMFFVFYLYMNWVKEIWDDVPIVLYGSIIMLTVTTLLSIGIDGQRFLDFNCMTAFYKVLVFFGVYCFVSGLIVAINKSVFLSSMFTFFCYLVVLFDCCLIAKREGSWDWLTRILFLVGFICCIQTIVAGKPMINGGVTVYTMGTLNNPHSLSYVILLGIFGLLIKENYELKNIVCRLFFIVFFIYAIMLTGSRKGLIAAVILCALWLLGSFRHYRDNSDKGISSTTVFFVAIVVIIIIICLFRYYRSTDQFERFLRLFGNGEDTSNETRVEMYHFAYALWKKNPLFGVGFDQYRCYSLQKAYSHSTYAEVLSCTGVIGFLILIMPIIRNLFGTIKYIICTKEKYHYILWICLAGIIIELFLGVGQIWIYGINHELFLIYICGIYESLVIRLEHNEVIKKGENGKCRYLL